MASRVQPPIISLKDRVAALEQRNTSVTPSNASSPHTSPASSPSKQGALRDKIARFEQKGGIPVPRGSFGLGAPPVTENGQTRRVGELYGNRVSGLNRPSGLPPPSVSRSGSPLSHSRKLSLSTSNVNRPFSPSSPPSSSPSPSPSSPPSSLQTPTRSDSAQDEYASLPSALSPLPRRNSFTHALGFAKKMEESAIANGIGLPFVGEGFGLMAQRMAQLRGGPTAEATTTADETVGQDILDSVSKPMLYCTGSESDFPPVTVLSQPPSPAEDVPSAAEETAVPAEVVDMDSSSSCNDNSTNIKASTPTPSRLSLSLGSSQADIDNQPIQHEQLESTTPIIVVDDLRLSTDYPPTPSSPNLAPIWDHPSPAEDLPVPILATPLTHHSLDFVQPSPPASPAHTHSPTDEGDIGPDSPALKSPSITSSRKSEVEVTTSTGPELFGSDFAPSAPPTPEPDVQAAANIDVRTAAAVDVQAIFTIAVSPARQVQRPESDVRSQPSPRSVLSRQHSTSRKGTAAIGELPVIPECRPLSMIDPRVIVGDDREVNMATHISPSKAAFSTFGETRDELEVPSPATSSIDDIPDARMSSQLTAKDAMRSPPRLSLPVSVNSLESEGELSRPCSWSSSGTPPRPLSIAQVREARVFTPVTSRAVPLVIPPLSQTRSQDELLTPPGDDVGNTDEDFGYVTVLGKEPINPSHLPAALSEPKPSMQNKPVSFKVVVHQKVTELPAVATNSRFSITNTHADRMRRGTKSESMLRSPAWGELATLLQDTAMLEQTLCEGHIPSEELERPTEESINPSSATCDASLESQSVATLDDPSSGTRGARSLLSSSSSSISSRCLSTLRRIKESTASVVRSMPGSPGSLKTRSASASTSSELSFEQCQTHGASPGSTVAFPTTGSPSSHKNKHLLRAASFADRLLLRSRTQSTASRSDDHEPDPSSPTPPKNTSPLPRSVSMQPKYNWPPSPLLQNNNPSRAQQPHAMSSHQSTPSIILSALSPLPVSALSSHSSSSSPTQGGVSEKQMLDTFPRVSQLLPAPSPGAPANFFLARTPSRESRGTETPPMPSSDTAPPRRAAAIFRPRMYSHT